MVAGELVRARWVVGADGTSSRVRNWAKLDPQESDTKANKKLRFAFRRHYRVAPWADFMELHWGQDCQIYVTPVSREEVCVAMISSSPKLRLENALGQFPELCARLNGAAYTSNERGAITATRKLRRVYRGRTVLIGDASGGIDAITGEGLCLTFRQAALLGECLAEGDLARYQKGHRALGRRPALMSRMMLFMAKHPHLRTRTMRMFATRPAAFAGMLAMHVGEGSARDHLRNGIAMGWQMLRA
jgi:flavin-dependent dehydrogenase